MPTTFRRVLEERWGDDQVFVTSLDGTSALVYPLQVWTEREERLMTLPASHRARRRFLERVNYYGQQLQLDSQGRVVVPQILRDSADVTGEVVVCGRLDHLEVWNHERFESKLSEEPFSDDDLDALAELGV